MKNLLFFLIFSSALCFGQGKEKVDSLKSVLQTSNIQDSAHTALKLSYLYRRTKKDSSRYYAEIAIEKALQLQNDSLLAAAYFQRAFPEYYDYNHGVALEYYVKVDSLSEGSEKLTQLIIETKLYRSEISKFTFTMEGVLKAREYIQEGIKLAESQRDSFYVNKMKYHLGGWHSFISQEVAPEKHRDTARSLLNAVLPYFKKTGNKSMEADVYNSLWGIYSNMDEDKKAEFYLKKRLKTIKQIGDSVKLAQVYYYNGAYYRTRKKPNLALTYLDSATQVYEKVGYVNDTRKKDVLKDEAYALEQLGQWKAAFLKLQEAFVLKDDIFRDKNVQAGIEMEAKYQADKKEQEIALLTSQGKVTEEQRKNERNLFLGGLILLLVAGLFFFFQYRNRQKTNRKLKELDTAKSTFFANISHEFRTPLSLIKGPIEDQLNLKTLPKTQHNNLLAAQRNTHRLESLIEQLLALSKLESGNIKLQVQPGHLSPFIAAQIEVFSYKSLDKKIKTEVHLPESTDVEWFDRDLFEKVISNLMGNAVKYTPEKGIITITGKREDSIYKVSVKNSGAFLTQEQQNNIFQRFYQTDPKNPGTGIGLSLTKELIELHKGTVSVKSEENKNTEFIISIPITKNTYTEAEILLEEVQKPKSETVSAQKTDSEAKIEHDENTPILLIVDDSEEIRDYVASVFEKEYVTIKAANGKEGFEMAKSEIPDIIISDVLMPIEDGLNLTKNVKKDPLTSHIPIILLTAKNNMVDKLEAMGLGADAYITKPFSSKLVKATAANLIETRRKLQQRFAQEVILTPKEMSISSADEQFLDRLQKVIDEHITNPDFTVDLFGTEMGVSRMQLHRKLKALTGYSTTEFLRNQRLKLAAQLLKTDKISVSEVGYTVGFNDISYFGKCFKKEFGCAPSEYTTK